MRQQHWSKESPVRIALILLVFLLAAVGVFLYGQYLDARERKPEERGTYEAGMNDFILELDGVKYRRRARTTTILLMGIDQESGTEQRGSRSGGQADFLRLIVIDRDLHQVSQLQIDRDTMTRIVVLGVMGNRAGTRTAQISLAHGFGDGRHVSCELTAEAVSTMLWGTPIDYYFALNMDGIALLNDLLGGVTVTLAEDFTAFDPAMERGATLTLNGRQAEAFVRSRMSVGDGTNASRMVRQEQYLQQAAILLDQKIHEGKDDIASLLDRMGTYVTTNFSRGTLISQLWDARDYERKAAIKPDGIHQVAEDGFMEFHVDQESLRDALLNMLYDRKP